MKKTLVAIFFAGNDVGRFEGLRAAKGKVKGTISLGSGLAGLAAASDDLLLAATGEGKLLLLDAFCGALLAEDSTLDKAPIDATPAVWTGGILAVNRDGVMTCFE
jgi:hypothetical protein